MALSEKTTPENTRKATKDGVKILNSKFTKMKKYISSNYKFKTNTETVHNNYLWCLFHELKHDG